MTLILKRGENELRIEADPSAANDRYVGFINGQMLTAADTPPAVLAVLIRSNASVSVLICEEVSVDAFGEIRHRRGTDR